MPVRSNGWIEEKRSGRFYQKMTGTNLYTNSDSRVRVCVCVFVCLCVCVFVCLSA